MRIGSVDISKDVLVVAEIGNNHEGDIALAEEMVRQAASAGAQAVKFQTIIPEQLVAPDQQARLEQLRRYQLSAEQHRHLARVAESCGVMFMSTPFSLDAVDLLDPIVPAFKIASGDNNFTALLEKVAETGKPVLLSTGMTEGDDASVAAATLDAVWKKRKADPGLVLLHCVSAYPTPPEQANLRAIGAVAALGRPVGYSDHVLGIEASVAAVVMGARVIEKHFTLSKTQSAFRDHQLSAEPAELREMVDRIRVINAMLGDGIKRVMAGEEAVAQAARRSVCAARDLAAGHVLGVTDMICLRPAGGIAPDRMASLIGRKVGAAMKAGQPLPLELAK